MVGTVTNADDADDLVLLTNTPAQTVSLPYTMKQADGVIGLCLLTNKTKFTPFKEDRAISTLRI